MHGISEGSNRVSGGAWSTSGRPGPGRFQPDLKFCCNLWYNKFYAVSPTGPLGPAGQN